MGTARDGNTALAVRAVLQEGQVKKRKRRSVAASRAASLKAWRTRRKMKEVRVDDGKWHNVARYGKKTFVDGKLAKPLISKNARIETDENWPHWMRAVPSEPHIVGTPPIARDMLPTINRIPKVEWS
jgi:hypothetical protein